MILPIQKFWIFTNIKLRVDSFLLISTGNHFGEINQNSRNFRNLILAEVNSLEKYEEEL